MRALRQQSLKRHSRKDPRYIATVRQLLASQAYRESMAAHLFGHGARLEQKHGRARHVLNRRAQDIGAPLARARHRQIEIIFMHGPALALNALDER